MTKRPRAKLAELLAQHLSGHEYTEALDLLEAFDRDKAMERGEAEGEEEGEALDQEEGEPLPEWASDPEQRRRHWNALDRFMRKKGASDADMTELREMWIGHFGELPRTALSGRMGGALAGDRRLRAARRARQAMDRSRVRWPESARLDPQSALETSYGAQPTLRLREPTAQGTIDRWPDAFRIGVA